MTELDKTSARQGATGVKLRYVLTISTVLAAVALGAVAVVWA